jgi:hypothetical protein
MANGSDLAAQRPSLRLGTAPRLARRKDFQNSWNQKQNKSEGKSKSLGRKIQAFYFRELGLFNWLRSPPKKRRKEAFFRFSPLSQAD